MEDLIREFLSSGYGDSYGDGDGSGDGDGISEINGRPVVIIDRVQTVVDKVRGDIAKGAILQSDLTLSPCFVVKSGGTFAHGATLRAAQRALAEKLLDGEPEEARIAAFVKAHALGQEYPNMDFFAWHHTLTGSCEMGRRQFAADHGIDLDGSMTTKAFLELTADAYGKDIIRKTLKAYSTEEGQA